MTWDQYLTVLRRLQEQNIKLNYLHFTGGEPTLWQHLKPAIEKAKEIGIAKTIRVVTNAVDRNADDYGDCDVIHISHYGAINRQDINRIKKQAKQKVKVQFTVHLPWPYQSVNGDSLPADCGCINLAFLGDRVYPCGLAAAMENDSSLSVEDDFYKIFCNRNPHMQELCRGCLSNRKNKVKHMEGLTAEFGIWDSPISGVVSLKTKALGLRKIYRSLIR